MKRPATSCAFSALGNPKAKLLLLGPTNPLFGALLAQARSLNFEHVSPASLVQQEISRRTPLGHSADQQSAAVAQRGTAVPDQTLLAIVRKWFWARKPDAGFLLEGFPATLLHAKVFDEWLEARGETLTAVFAADLMSADLVVAHYRTQGLLASPAQLASPRLSLSKVA